MTHGNFVVFENCHLDIKLTVRLCVDYQRAIDTESVHDDFRLWCVTAPTPDFPIVVLRQAVKFACNPPNNLKERISRHAVVLTDDKYLRFSVALVTLHAVLQERRAFGTNGWNCSYSFADHLLRQSFTCFKSLMKVGDDPTALNGVAYLVAECIHGGLVIDHLDRRVLRALFERICRGSATTHFEKSSICIPVELTTDNWTKTIDSLPPHKTRAVDVGLHANCEFERGSHQCEYILSTLAQFDPPQADEAATDSTRFRCTDILDRLPSPLPVGSGSPDGPFDLIRRHEVMRFNRLLECVRTTLAELLRAIDGDIHMIDDLQRIYRSLQANRIPCAWLPFVYRTSKSLAAFVIDLIARVAYFGAWDNTTTPKKLWFPAFYNPAALVTGMQTKYAIANGIDLADVRVQCTVSMESIPGESISVEVSVFSFAEFDSSDQRCLPSLHARCTGPSH